ncbi:MAG: 3-hydroxyacyl-CoA dehydrogenase family protein [Bacteroidales bacterium]|nr:3-hydroxyacyl-CoA dehydrogenase family protein [Bacteroidales bacterium]
MIKKIGIAGSGKMGSDIFNYLSDFKYELIWFTRNSDHKEILHNTYRKKIKRQLKHGIISKEIFDLRYKYRTTFKLTDLSECDLIIESVIEEPEIKSVLFQKLDEIVKPSCILASNSSSILPSALSENIKRKNRLIGLHFFYPLAFKNVVEVISSEFTDEITLEKIKLFLVDIKRFYIEQNEDNAFVLNRLLLQIQITAFELLKEYGLGYKQFDDIAKQFVTEFGLFEMMDHVGHNTMHNAIMNYSRMDSDKKKYEPILNDLKSRDPDSGKNSGNLFYDKEFEIIEIPERTEQEIISKLKGTADRFLTNYSEDFQINLFNLKKGLEEFGGIML